MHFLIWNYCVFRFKLKLVPYSSINNKPSLVEIIAWHRTSDKPFEPMVAQETGANMHQRVNPWRTEIFIKKHFYVKIRLSLQRFSNLVPDWLAAQLTANQRPCKNIPVNQHIFSHGIYLVIQAPGISLFRMASFSIRTLYEVVRFRLVQMGKPRPSISETW